MAFAAGKECKITPDRGEQRQMRSKPNIKRETVDLSSFPDLVVIYLGMKALSPRGILTLLTFGLRISAAITEKPAGLLLHEPLFFSFFPLHAGMRQYWRDFDSLESWARALPHQKWWQDFARDTGGTAFWHEAYFVRGRMEAVYLDMNAPFGFSRFAPVKAAEGAMFSARQRIKRKEKSSA